MSHFYLTLPSNSSMKFFPDNTAQKYVTRLANQISLSGAWEVGLFELEFQKSWYPISAESCRFRYHYLLGDVAKSEYLRIPVGFYPSMKDVVTKINTAIATFSTTIWPREKWANFKYDEFTQKISVQLRKGDNFEFSEEMKNVLGFSIPYMIGTMMDSYTWPADEVCDLDRRVRSLYVYCDILEHVPIGDVKAPLLRTVAINGKHGERIRQIFDKPLYVPIQKKNFDTIEIDIRSETGDIVPFQFGQSSVTLHFRLSKNPYFLQ